MGAYMPLSSLVELDESLPPIATFGLLNPLRQLPPTKLNLCSNALVQRQILEEVVPVVMQCRIQRQQLEENWREILRMEYMTHDTGRRYFGRHNSYIPLWARAKKILVSNLSKGIFPSDEYLDVQDRISRDPEKAKPVKTLIQWEFERNANLKRWMKPFLGNLVSFGNGVMKHWYRKDMNPGMRTGFAGPLRQNPQLQYGSVVTEGFAVQPVSIFSFYFWPTSAMALEDCALVFQDIDLPRVEIEKLILAGRFENGERALNAPEPPEHMRQMGELHSNLNNIPSPQQQALTASKLGTIRTLTEVWTTLVLPPEALVPGEDPNCRYSVRLVMAGEYCVEARRNPFIHQRPPYEFQAANQFPGLGYGYGEGKLARPTSLLVNDFFNQTADVAEYTLNPIIKANPGLIVGKLLPVAPGRIYQMMGMDGMEFDRPPAELIQYGYQVINQLQAMSKDNVGATTQLQGASQSKTATVAQLDQRNAMTPIQDQVEDTEIAVMVPLMRACWMYAQQWRDQATVTQVAGQMMVVSPRDLIIDPEFRWLASSQAVNQAQRAQNAMTLLSAIGPMIPYLNQLGYLVDPVILLNRIFSDGFGFRGFSDFVRKVGMTPATMLSAQSQANQGVQQAQAVAFDRARSTLEQIAGRDEAPDMVPGEGEDFMDVRNNADSLAAMNGGMNGKLY